jgi:hypothetical protein
MDGYLGGQVCELDGSGIIEGHALDTGKDDVLGCASKRKGRNRKQRREWNRKKKRAINNHA